MNSNYYNNKSKSAGVRNQIGSTQIIITIFICTELFTKAHGSYLTSLSQKNLKHYILPFPQISVTEIQGMCVRPYRK